MLNPTELEKLRQTYVGRCIKLLDMPHDAAPVTTGTEGTCIGVDAMGNLMMKWDNGSRLSLIPGIDKYEVI